MFHSGTQTLIDHWTALPAAGRIPARSAFAPLAFGLRVPQLFSADRTADGARFRLAGAWVEGLHGRPLRGLDWLDLWRPDSQSLVAASIVQAFREGRPVVLAAEAPDLVGLVEVVIAPLRSASGAADRLVGLYQPVSAIDRTAEAVGLLGARLSIAVGPRERPRLALAAVGGRRIA